MAAIFEMPQYVAYQKNVVYAFIKLSAKSHSLTFCAQWMGLAALLIFKIHFLTSIYSKQQYLPAKSTKTFI